MKYLSLFTGIGGFEVGIENAYGIQKAFQDLLQAEELQPKAENTTIVGQRGLDSKSSTRLGNSECIGFSEIDKYACQVYSKHYPEHFNYGDITKIIATELPDFDLLVGGFPCQAFSIAGKRRGFDDTRGTLFFDIARIAKAKEPMFMLLENVKGLVSHDKGKTLETILATLQELGYYVNYEIRNSKNYGVPQNRERIFLLCKHIKLLSSVGKSEKMTTSENIIQEWLFQILLNNLGVAKKLQGHESKDWVLGYLICQEISQNPSLLGENILDGISMDTVEKSSLFKGEPWQNIDIWLKKNLGENLRELNKSTISTAINEIIESKTYTFLTMFQSILLATVLLRQSSSHLWNEVLSSLILIQEDTKYARINNENEKAIITESGTAHITAELQDFSKYFIIGHLGGIPERKVFPIRESYEKIGAEIKRIGHNDIFRRYNQTYQIDGSCEALDTSGGGGHQPCVPHNARIRRLTPIECERLQGFPDNWTAEGINGKISDTQRYKMCGNAVTTNVITELIKRLYE